MVVNSNEQLNILMDQIVNDICNEFGFPGWNPLLPIVKAEDYAREAQKHVCRINGKVELLQLPLRVYTVPCEYQVDRMTGEAFYTNFRELQCYVCPYCGKVILLKDTI